MCILAYNLSIDESTTKTGCTNRRTENAALHQRLEFHISGRVDKRRRYHWTLDFVHDNFAPMATAMCLVGHIVDDLDTYAMYERLLVLPKEDMLEDMFKIMSNLPSDHALGQLEGCYLYYDTKKKK